LFEEIAMHREEQNLKKKHVTFHIERRVSKARAY